MRPARVVRTPSREPHTTHTPAPTGDAGALPEGVEDAAHTRLCIITKNNPGVLAENTTLLGSNGVNIVQQLNTSREAIAYNVIDMQDYPHEDGPARGMQEQILAIPDVLSTRLIWTGRASEGPSHFYTVNSHSMDC